jgi:hypothetical protein
MSYTLERGSSGFRHPYRDDLRLLGWMQEVKLVLVPDIEQVCEGEKPFILL